jgi:hypothetical protein
MAKVVDQNPFAITIPDNHNKIKVIPKMLRIPLTMRISIGSAACDLVNIKIRNTRASTCRR